MVRAVVRAVDIERATRKGTQSFVGAIDGFDWSITESKSGCCEVRIQHGDSGPKNCHVIAKKAKWVYTPQIIANYINKEQAK